MEQAARNRPRYRQVRSGKLQMALFASSYGRRCHLVRRKTRWCSASCLLTNKNANSWKSVRQRKNAGSNPKMRCSRSTERIGALICAFNARALCRSDQQSLSSTASYLKPNQSRRLISCCDLAVDTPYLNESFCHRPYSCNSTLCQPSTPSQ